MANISDLAIGVDFKRCDKCEYKRDASFRDNLLITAGARAAYMDGTYIGLPSGVEGEAELALYISRLVDSYMLLETEQNFDLYIETALLEKYGYKED